MVAVLILLPIEANGQWDVREWEDRSDEVWDELDSGNQTTWILVGAGVAVTGAVVAYTLRKRKAAERAEEGEQKEKATAMVQPFSDEPSNLQRLADDQHGRPVNVVLGLHPSARRPIVGFRVRF